DAGATAGRGACSKWNRHAWCAAARRKWRCRPSSAAWARSRARISGSSAPVHECGEEPAGIALERIEVVSALLGDDRGQAQRDDALAQMPEAFRADLDG